MIPAMDDEQNAAKGAAGNLSCPTGFAFSFDGHTLRLSAQPPLSRPVLLRGVLTALALAAGVAMPGGVGTVLLLGGLVLSVMMLFLVIRVAVVTRVEMTAQTSLVEVKGAFGRTTLEVPSSEFHIEGAGHLCEDSDEGPDRLPVHYLGIRAGGETRRLFVGHRRECIEWARSVLSKNWFGAGAVEHGVGPDT